MVLSIFDQDVDKCTVAEMFLGENNCCGGFKKACDQGVDPPDITRIYRDLFNIAADFVHHPVAFSTLQKQIDDSELPLQVLITWGPNNGKHVIVVDGWRIKNQVQYVKVKDPYYSDGDVPFEDLRNDYSPDHGEWEGTWIGFEEV